GGGGVGPGTPPPPPAIRERAGRRDCWNTQQRRRRRYSRCRLPIAALLLEAAGAVHRLVGARLEGQLCRATALRARRRIHLSRRALVVAPPATVAAVAIVGHAAAALGLARGTALRAAGRLVREALLRVELLLAFGENEGCAAVSAGKGLVRVAHVCLPRE